MTTTLANDYAIDTTDVSRVSPSARQARNVSTPKADPPAGQPLRLVQITADDHRSCDESHPLDPDHVPGDTQKNGVGVDPPADDHTRADTQTSDVVGDPTDPGHKRPDAQSTIAGVTLSASPAIVSPAPTPDSSGWLELRIWAEMFSDAQLARIAAVNRAERGGVDPALYAAYLDNLKAAEHHCGLAMRRCLRRVAPAELIAWQKGTLGIGEHQLALLLGHLGHPRIATPHHWEGTGAKRELIADEPFERSISQLWQYCGHGAPERKRKGMTAAELAAQGKPNLKSIVWNISVACMKNLRSPYRLVYDDAREQYADKTHGVECVRCGPSGKPAQVGSPWSPGHQHAAALRLVGKEVLRDLWKVTP